MRILSAVGRGLAAVLLTVAKTLGGMGGARTFDHDTAAVTYRKRDEYRP